jgi:ketosteroid isomerase-like protein
MRRVSFWAVLFTCAVLAPGGAYAAGEGEFTGEKAVIEDVIEASIGWAIEKDTKLLFDSVAQDEDFFYFSPDSASTISGFKMFKKFTHDTFMGDNFKALWYKTKDMSIKISESGDVAWYHCLLDDVGLWNGVEAGWHDVRWTGVLEKRDGEWKIVQMHFSFSAEQMRRAMG